MTRIVRVDRREFLQATGLATAGAFLIGCGLDSGPVGPGEDFEINMWVAIYEGGQVRIVSHRSEMGQGTRTSLPAVVADEMEADWGQVEIVQALGDEKYGSQNTDGSRSVRMDFQKLREAGASVRHMLVAAAAATWSVDVSECVGENHEVHHKASGRKLGYGELASAAAKQAVPAVEELKLKSHDEFRYIGTAFPITDLDDILRGTAVYGIDAEVDGMLYASIERCPVLGGNSTGFDQDAAMAVKGVHSVVKLPTGGRGAGYAPLGGVAVLADNTWSANSGRDELNVQWEMGEHSSYESVAYRKAIERSASKAGTVARDRGNVDTAFRSASKVVEAAYYAPHLAHAPMEPPSALASVGEDSCEIWAPTQNPQGAQDAVSGALGIEKEKVKVHVTLLGGGFGRKSKPDFIVEAALLSKEAGRPVKVNWTREDDIRHCYLHSVSAQTLKAGLDSNGKPTAWRHRSAFPPIAATFDPSNTGPRPGDLNGGAVDLPYDIPNIRMEACPADTHVRIGWLRSVANIYHAFAVCSFADELAAAAGRDPKDYLMELVGADRHVELDGAQYSNLDKYPIDTARLKNVLQLVAEEANWGSELPQGHGRGIAVHRSFYSYVAAVVHVAVDDDKLRVEDVHIGIDAGTVVNTDRVHAQMEGAVIFGLSGALYGEITAADGAIIQSNYHNYKMLRIDAAPKSISTHIVESREVPTGVGEPGVPPVAPALMNAIFAATGKRIRELPLSKTGMV